MDDSGNIYRNMQMTSHNFGGINLYRIASSGEEALEKLLNDRGLVAGIHGGMVDSVPGEWIAHYD